MKTVCAKSDIGEPTFCAWKKKCGGTDASEARWMRMLEDENAWLRTKQERGSVALAVAPSLRFGLPAIIKATTNKAATVPFVRQRNRSVRKLSVSKNGKPENLPQHAMPTPSLRLTRALFTEKSLYGQF